MIYEPFLAKFFLGPQVILQFLWRTITLSTTLVSKISLRGQLFLGVTDPSAARATLESETGAQALRQGIAGPFNDLEPETGMKKTVCFATCFNQRNNSWMFWPFQLPIFPILKDAVELLGFSVVTGNARRLSSAGQLMVDYLLTVAVGAAARNQQQQYLEKRWEKMSSHLQRCTVYIYLFI